MDNSSSGGEIIKLIFTITIPSCLESPLLSIVLLLRRLRFGYPFRRIPLTQGKYAIVDPDDFDRLNNYKWHISRGKNTFYAVRTTRLQKQKKRVVIKMHRQILKVPDDIFVDHINHNGLDNRKANLRPATCTQNNRNRRKLQSRPQQGRSRSKYKGLTWYKHEKRWAVRIMVDRQSKFIGYFRNEIDAAKTYDKAAKKYYGEFAVLNFPQTQTDKD